MGKIVWWQFLLPTTWWKYLRGVKRGRQRRISRPDSMMTPGLAIVDADGVLRYIHRGKTLGDVPSVDTVLAELDGLDGLASPDGLASAAQRPSPTHSP